MIYEFKVDYKDQNKLKTVIEAAYFKNGNTGKISSKKSFLCFSEEDNYNIIFRGMDNMIIKISNAELIDGSMRCILSEDKKGIKLFPINTYCIITEQNKYSFY